MNMLMELDDGDEEMPDLQSLVDDFQLDGEYGCIIGLWEAISLAKAREHCRTLRARFPRSKLVLRQIRDIPRFKPIPGKAHFGQ